MARMGDDRLTPGNIRAMEYRDVLHDDVVTGLDLRCGRSRKSWRLYYRTRGGVERRPTIGAWPTLNIETARRAARELLERVAKGEDPSAEWQSERGAPTVADLWQAYLPWLTANRAEGTVAEYARQAKSLLLPHSIARMRVRDVQLTDVETWVADVRSRRLIVNGHTPDQKTAVHAGTRAAAMLSGMFKFAELRTGTPPWRVRGSNPCTGVSRPPGRKRGRYATPEEMQRIGKALTDLEPVYPRHVALLRVLMFTGTRTSEPANAEWRDLAADRAKLTLKHHKTARTAGDKEVQVSAPARQELERLARLPIPASGRIFGDDLAKDRPLRALWERVRDRAGCPDLQIRDLRRTFASLAFDPSAGENVNQRIIGDLLGHSQATTTQIYTVLFADVRQRAAETTAQRVATLLGGATAPVQSALKVRTRVRRIADRRQNGSAHHPSIKSPTAFRKE